MIITLLISVLNLDIIDFKFIDIKSLKNIAEYQFSLLKCVCTLSNLETLDIYLRIIKKGKIKESLFCYWYLLYEEQASNFSKKDIFSSIVNKASISDIYSEKYKNSVFLEIENNTSDILKFGTEVHFIDFVKYIEYNKTQKPELKNWLNYIDKSSSDFLMIGLVSNKSANNNIISII